MEVLSLLASTHSVYGYITLMEEKNNHQSELAINSISYNKDLPDKIRPVVQLWHEYFGTLRHLMKPMPDTVNDVNILRVKKS